MQIKLQIIISFFIFNCFVVQVSTQNQYYPYPRYDNTWIIGAGGSKYSIMTFNNDSLKVIEEKNYIIPFDECNITISDSIGKLVYFSNGLQIANKNFKIMDGGDRINPSTFLDQYLESGEVYNIVISLPYPNKKNTNILFHQNVLIQYNPTANIFSNTTYSSTIKLDANNQEGKVENVNNVIRENIFSAGMITATKHGNGLDWWIPVLGQDNNTFFMFKVNSQGASFSHTQSIGSYIYHPFGQAVFSPNGNYYTRVDAPKIGAKTFFDVFKFDRCTGLFSDFKNVILEEAVKSLTVCGAAISPNSKYLYITYQNYIFQYDLEAKDIAASKDTVAIYDGFKDPDNLNWPTYFWKAQIAPNGKIYINTGNYATSYLHVIDNPDMKGKACNVLQHKIKLPTTNGFTMPNFPNYRLGPLKGSPCDTLHVANKDITLDDFDIKLFPNPASTEIKIDITLKEYDPAIKTEVVIVDVSGAIVQKYTMPDFAYIATIDISKLTSGVYGIQLRQPKKFGERVLAVEKLVVIR